MHRVKTFYPETAEVCSWARLHSVIAVIKHEHEQLKSWSNKLVYCSMLKSITNFFLQKKKRKKEKRNLLPVFVWSKFTQSAFQSINTSGQSQIRVTGHVRSWHWPCTDVWQHGNTVSVGFESELKFSQACNFVQRVSSVYFGNFTDKWWVSPSPTPSSLKRGAPTKS